MRAESPRHITEPNFFLVGAGKCGTTSLYAYLRQHPQVFMPERKELHFFSTDLERPNRISEAEYFGLFNSSEHKECVGEASADYLYSEAACKGIRERFPDAKIIITLRNPVDQMYSMHGYSIWLGREDIVDFEAALARDKENIRSKMTRRRSYIEGAKYAKYVRMYLDTFGREQVHVILFEDMVDDSNGVFGELCRFLDIRQDVRIAFRRHNARRRARSKALSMVVMPSSRAVRLGKKILGRRRVLGQVVRTVRRLNTRFVQGSEMSPELGKRLEEEFAEDVTELSRLLERDLWEFWFSSKERAGAVVAEMGAAQQS